MCCPVNQIVNKLEKNQLRKMFKNVFEAYEMKLASMRKIRMKPSINTE